MVVVGNVFISKVGSGTVGGGGRMYDDDIR